MTWNFRKAYAILCEKSGRVLLVEWNRSKKITNLAYEIPRKSK